MKSLVARPGKVEVRSGGERGPTVLLTGQRQADRFRVDLVGRPVWLPCAALTALIKLIVTRLRAESGLAAIDRVTIFRLRRALGNPAREEFLAQLRNKRI